MNCHDSLTPIITWRQEGMSDKIASITGLLRCTYMNVNLLCSRTPKYVWCLSTYRGLRSVVFVVVRKGSIFRINYLGKTRNAGHDCLTGRETWNKGYMRLKGKEKLRIIPGHSNPFPTTFKLLTKVTILSIWTSKLSYNHATMQFSIIALLAFVYLSSAENDVPQVSSYTH